MQNLSYGKDLQWAKGPSDGCLTHKQSSTNDNCWKHALKVFENCVTYYQSCEQSPEQNIRPQPYHFFFLFLINFQISLVSLIANILLFCIVFIYKKMNQCSYKYSKITKKQLMIDMNRYNIIFLAINSDRSFSLLLSIGLIFFYI